MTKLYLLDVFNGIEPRVAGPYATEEVRSKAALKMRDAQDENDAIFWADVDENGNLEVGSFSGGFFLKMSQEGNT